MSILKWGKPEKAIPHGEWLEISADGAPPGVYTSNMSEADALAWKAKMAGQRTPGELRVEVRKTVISQGTDNPRAENGWKRDKGRRPATYAQVVLLVYEDGELRMSANAQMAFSPAEWQEMSLAITEAHAAMMAYRQKEGSR